MTAALEALSPSEPAGVDTLHEEPGRRLRIYIWQVPVRATHWVTAGCIVVLSLTGGYIADPFLIPAGGSTMMTARLIHMVGAIALRGSGLVRAWWLLAGTRFSRWSAFMQTPSGDATELCR